MAFSIQQHVKKDKTVKNLRIIKIFHVIYDKFRDFTPKLINQLNPTDRPPPPNNQCAKMAHSAAFVKKLSENYDMQNSPWREQGLLLAAQMVNYQRL